MLDVEVIPSKSVGEFKIGMPMSAAISYIQKSYKTISTVDLKYCEEDLLNTYLLIDLKDEGLLLRFEPRTQRLHSVEVHDLTRVVLRYCGAAFSGPDTQPTFDLIYRRFGPSFPGEYNPETRIYCLDYPGVTFLFPIPEHAHFDGSASDLPIEFADGTSPEVARMLVYHGEKTDTSIPPLDPKDDYFEELRVHASHGIRFMRRGCRLDFQSTAQDVLTELGRPDRTFYKHEDKMKIHSGDQAIIGAGCEDYFYNYFKLGLDVLFDMRTHVVKKFIFHTNFPCHHDFNVYNKCNFKLFFGSPDEVDSASESEGAESSGADETPDEEEVEPAAPKRRSARDHNGEEEEEEEEEDQEDEEPLQRANGGPKGGNNTNNGGKKNNNKKNKKKNRSRRGRGGPARVDDNDDNDDAEELARSPDGKKNGAKPGAADVRPAATRDKGKGKDKGKERDDGVPAVEAKGVAKPLHYIHPDMKWEEMQQVLPGAPSKPVVNTTSSPFGSTLFYGHKDLIFEVMRNGHVASICMFSSSSSSA